MTKNIVVMGKGDLAVVCIPILKKKGHKLVVFLTRGDHELIALCNREELEYYFPDDLNSDLWVRYLKDLNPDLLLSLQCPYYLQPKIFKTAKKAVNLHFALCPKHRGMYPIAHAILAGDKFGGATLHYIEKKLDSGDIIAQRRFEIPDGCTAEELYDMTVKEGIKLFEENIDSILDDKESRVPQKEEDSCYHDKNSIDFSKCEMKLSEEQKRFLLAYYFPRFQRPFVKIGNKKFAFYEVKE